MNPLAQLILVTASPLQHFLDKPALTHGFCNAQAVSILASDGAAPNVDFFRYFLQEIDRGSAWADSQWKNIDHYFNPDTGRGIWPFGNAMDTFQQYLADAMKQARRGNRRKAAFFLGAAAHLLQDLCVPHHARGRMFNGHQDYEGWVLDHFGEYAVDCRGCYLKTKKITDLATDNARTAAALFDAVDLERGCVDYAGVTAITLPLAQKATAGLFENFYRTALVSSFTVSFAQTGTSISVA